MKIIYPYNEILPLKKAHDAYIVRNCASLATQGEDVTLLCGKGSLSKAELFAFYKIDANNPLKIVYLPILRRNNYFRLQWNYVFFKAACHFIQKQKPDIVLFSVLKLAHYLLKNRLPQCRYVYEVHQLKWYPTVGFKYNLSKISFEQSILNRCDLVTTTTHALKNILSKNPYAIKTPLQVLALACDFSPLKKTSPSKPLKLYYIGQLYAKQGLHRLLSALKDVDGVQLTVVGGKGLQIRHYQNLCQQYQMQHKVTFKGFIPPEQFSNVLAHVDAFVTTFDHSERMPYVAHTKLYEYLAWQKPILAPELEIVKEHAPFGVMHYNDQKENTLTDCLRRLQKPQIYNALAQEVVKNQVFSWQKRGGQFQRILNEPSLETVVN